MATITPETPWRDPGDCPFETFERALSGSPIRADGPPLGALYDALRPHTRLWLGLSWCENKHHTTGILLPFETKNNLSLTVRGYPEERGRVGATRFAAFDSYLDCARAFLRRLDDPGLPYRGTRTVMDFVRVYHPSGDTHPVTGEVNSAPTYARRLCDYINGLPGPEVVVPDAPKIEDIADAAVQRKYGLTPAAAQDVIHSRIEHRHGKRPEVVVLHVQQGTTGGSLRDHGTTVRDASATVYANLDGTLVRAVPEEHGPWTQGIKPGESFPTPRGAAVLREHGVTDANVIALSIEAEGWDTGPHPEAQLAAIEWQIREWQRKYPWIGNHEVLRHADFDQVNRGFCPGWYYNTITDRLGQGPTPPAPPFDPAALPEPVKRTLFGSATGPSGRYEYDPNGVVTKHWAGHPDEFRWSSLDRVVETPNGKYFRFTQGPLLFVDPAGKLVEVA